MGISIKKHWVNMKVKDFQLFEGINKPGWWFQMLFIFIPTWGRFPF